MALDLATIGENGAPEMVSIDLDVHQRLIQLNRGAPLLERIAEYYSDAALVSAEIPACSRRWKRVSTLPLMMTSC